MRSDMEKVAGHTELPWHAYRHWASPPTLRFDICGATRDDDVAENITEANAAFIVQAVNSHDELVAVTQRLLREVEAGGSSRIALNCMIEDAKAALARATKQKE